jgi:hypothetical protein
VGLRAGRKGAGRLDREHRAVHRVASRRARKDVLIATEDAEPYRYYEWGYPIIWKERLSIFAGDPWRVGEVINPRALREFRARPPFAIFMRWELWSQVEADLLGRYPQGRLFEVVPHRSRVVLDVPA